MTERDHLRKTILDGKGSLRLPGGASSPSIWAKRGPCRNWPSSKTGSRRNLCPHEGVKASEGIIGRRPVKKSFRRRFDGERRKAGWAREILCRQLGRRNVGLQSTKTLNGPKLQEVHRRDGAWKERRSTITEIYTDSVFVCGATTEYEGQRTGEGREGRYRETTFAANIPGRLHPRTARAIGAVPVVITFVVRRRMKKLQGPACWVQESERTIPPAALASRLEES